VLEDVARLSFVDPDLQRRIGDAVTALIKLRDQGRRTLTIRSEGTGRRTVHVAYVVAVPLWQSSYRPTLAAPPAVKTAALQGWAMVENQSGSDWKGVDLTLVSGNPVTFHQALYESYYVDRPEIPVEVVGRVLPRLDRGAVNISDKRALPAAFGG